MTRRTIAGLSVLALASLAACGSGGKSSSSDTTSVSASGSSPVKGKFPGLTKQANPGKLVWVDGGGATAAGAKATLLDPFTAQTGVQFDMIAPADIAQLRAMVVAGKTIWDIASVGPLIVSNCGLLFEKVDMSLYDDLDKYPEGSITPCSVPQNKSPIIMSYNTGAFAAGKEPKAIKDFFDTKNFPGKRIIYDDPGTSAFYEYALLASGVKPADLYPLDMARAQKEMDKVKSDLIIEPTFSALQNDLQANKWAMSINLSGLSVNAVQGGATMKPIWETTMVSVGGPGIVKGAPNLANAQLMQAFTRTHDASVAYAKSLGLYPANPTVKPEEMEAVLTDLQKTWSPFITPSKKGDTKILNVSWYADNGNALIASWTKYKVS